MSGFSRPASRQLTAGAVCRETRKGALQERHFLHLGSHPCARVPRVEGSGVKPQDQSGSFMPGKESTAPALKSGHRISYRQ